MTDSHEITHFDGSGSHGPVKLFLSDSGRAVYFCELDGTAWQACEPLQVRLTEGAQTSASPAMKPRGADAPSVDGDGHPVATGHVEALPPGVRALLEY